MDDWTPEAQPDGALTPPPRVPPTAIATATPEPPRRPAVRTTARTGWAGLLQRAFDGLDSIGDGIATAVGLR